MMARNRTVLTDIFSICSFRMFRDIYIYIYIYTRASLVKTYFSDKPSPCIDNLLPVLRAFPSPSRLKDALASSSQLITEQWNLSCNAVLLDIREKLCKLHYLFYTNLCKTYKVSALWGFIEGTFMYVRKGIMEVPAYLNVTNSMELKLSWEAASRPAIQEFPNILWNSKIHYHVHRTLHWFK
jgi:hypothetical protein